MELAISSEFTTGELAFINKELTKATKNISKAMHDSKESFVKAAGELARIKDEQLFKDDFTDEKGKPSFAMYCECVLGISKSKAYSIISTGKKLLYPELVNKEMNTYFSEFSDSALYILSTQGETYDDVKEFCKEHYIDETTPVSDIRGIVNGLKKAEKEESEDTEVEAEAESVEETEETCAEELEVQEVATILGLYRNELSELIKDDEANESAKDNWKTIIKFIEKYSV